jgi:hypothetical protein
MTSHPSGPRADATQSRPYLVKQAQKSRAGCAANKRINHPTIQPPSGYNCLINERATTGASN